MKQTDNLTPRQAREKLKFIQKIQDKNTHVGGWTLITLTIAIGGCLFTYNSEQKTVSQVALGLGGAALFLHGASMQIDQTSEKIQDDLTEIISKGK